MASPLGDGFRPPLAESAATVPSLPVTPGGFPALLDAARQQTELVFWIVRTVQEHEGKLQSLSRQLADQLSVSKLLSEDQKKFRSTRSHKWPLGHQNRGLSRESFNSLDGVLSQARADSAQLGASPADIERDKTHIEDMADLDLDDVLMPVEPDDPDQPLATVSDPGDPPGPRLSTASGRASDPRLSVDLSQGRRFSFLEGGRRPSTRSLPLQVDPSFAGGVVTEERLAERLEERLQVALNEDVEHRLEDLAQYIQEEMYHFVLGPDMMERVRQEASNMLQIELAVALAAQDKKMEDQLQARLANLGTTAGTPPVLAESDMSALQQSAEELNETSQELVRRMKLVEDSVADFKGLRLQVPDMCNDITTLQSNLAACVKSIEALEDRQPVPEAPTGPDEVEVDDLAPSGTPESRPDSPEAPRQGQSKRRLSDMLGLYMPPAQKPPAPVVDDSQMQELLAANESMQDRLDKMEQLVGTTQANISDRRNSLQNKMENKMSNVDSLALILQDRMRELDLEFRSTTSKVQSQLDLLLAAHETQQAEDLKHNKTWNLSNQVDVILSIVGSEMRAVRQEVDQKLKSVPEKPRPMSPTSEARDVQELEEKVKRLQDSQQQSTLKIAGLRSAQKHAEAQANFAVEAVKKIRGEVWNAVDQVLAQQTRLDYLMVQGAGGEISFQAAVSTAEKEKPKLKGGATMPTRPFEKVASQAAGDESPVSKTQSRWQRVQAAQQTVQMMQPAQSTEPNEEVNGSRLTKMGKRLVELDTELNRHMDGLRTDLQAVNTTLLAFLDLLPRRLRRMLQRQLFSEPAEEAEVKPGVEGRRVTFDEKVETRTFQVQEEEGRLPWQLTGEADIKWNWCYKPQDAMGRDLAMCLEQFETEREDFEAKMVQWLSNGGAPPAIAANFPEDSTVMIPQMMHLEERLERLGSEMFDLKRTQEHQQARKADREDLQVMGTRLSFFEKLNLPDLKSRIDSVEAESKFTARNLLDVSEKLDEVESSAALRSDLAQVRGSVEDARSEQQQLKAELKEVNASAYNANRKIYHELTEVKQVTQQHIVTLQKQKVDSTEVVQLVEKLSKLEHSIKDNRRILGDGGQEISAVVRRIILNLEDKIMILEKKIDAIADARHKDSFRSKEEMSHHSCYPSSELNEAAVQSVAEELSSMTEVVSKLKQDISVSKVHIEEMTEQGQQNLDLASRLHVLVQSTALENDDEGTALSLTRVQVMIAAAARQLVAGSKWITKETFDSRMEQIRAEYFKEIRNLQARLEELSNKAQGMSPMPAKLPKMIFQRLPNQVEEAAKPMTARARPATEGRRRA